jgi:putative ABC transport system permease protein
LGSTALATVLFVTLGYKTFFTRDNRLKWNLANNCFNII